MISNISFGSTYKVSAAGKDSIQQRQGYSDFVEFCDKNQFQYSEDINTRLNKPDYNLTCTTQATLVVPDRFDKMIDTFLVSNGIQFKRYVTNSLMQPRTINHRTQPAPKNMHTAYVNVRKLEQMLEQQDSNFEHCKSDYNKYYRDKLDFMLKSGDDIPASSLYITSMTGTNDALDYIEHFGKENLNQDSISFCLSQKTNAPDHCMYFAMKDAGMAAVPVYVDDNTYRLGLAMDLFEDTVY